MTALRFRHLVNLSEMAAGWNWVAARAPEGLSFHGFATGDHGPRRLAQVARWQAARAAARAAASVPDSLLVCHGPRMAAYLAAARPRKRAAAEWVWSFNFTDLPRGIARQVYARALRRAELLVVASKFEQAVYAAWFDLPPERIAFKPWGMDLDVASLRAEAPKVAGRYVCALGSQARDYGTLFEAMRRLPAVRLVVIADERSLQGLRVPDNVIVMTCVPRRSAMNVLAHAALMVLPMTALDARCGHVTVVSAMHAGVPVVATAARGLADYLAEDRGLAVPEHDVRAMADAVERLWSDDPMRAALAEAGEQFARSQCSEQSVVRFLQQRLAADAAAPRS